MKEWSIQRGLGAPRPKKENISPRIQETTGPATSSRAAHLGARRAILALGATLLLAVAGFVVGARFAAAQSCSGSCTGSCNNPPDSNPLGAYSSSSCQYSASCTCSGTTAVPGWCRSESCKKCSNQTGTPTAIQCQSQDACQLKQRNLCAGLC